MQYICIDRYENNINLLKEYYSMSTLEKLDKVDLQILRTLQENARLTTKELAARVSLSSTPVFERLKRLENGGYIKSGCGIGEKCEEIYISSILDFVVPVFFITFAHETS